MQRYGEESDWQTFWKCKVSLTTLWRQRRVAAMWSSSASITWRYRSSWRVQCCLCTMTLRFPQSIAIFWIAPKTVFSQETPDKPYKASIPLIHATTPRADILLAYEMNYEVPVSSITLTWISFLQRPCKVITSSACECSMLGIIWWLSGKVFLDSCLLYPHLKNRRLAVIMDTRYGWSFRVLLVLVL